MGLSRAHFFAIVLIFALLLQPAHAGPKVCFDALMKGASYTTNRITLATTANQPVATNVCFEQPGTNTQFVYTSGNDVQGVVSYTDQNGVTQTFIGTISRLIKTGSAVDVSISTGRCLSAIWIIYNRRRRG